MNGIELLNHYRGESYKWTYQVVSTLLVASTALLVLLVQVCHDAIGKGHSLVLLKSSALLASLHILCSVVVLYTLTLKDKHLTRIVEKALAQQAVGAPQPVVVEGQGVPRTYLLPICELVQYLLFAGEVCTLTIYMLRLP